MFHSSTLYFTVKMDKVKRRLGVESVSQRMVEAELVTPQPRALAILANFLYVCLSRLSVSYQ